MDRQKRSRLNVARQMSQIGNVCDIASFHLLNPANAPSVTQMVFFEREKKQRSEMYVYCLRQFAATKGPKAAETVQWRERYKLLVLKPN